MTDAAPAPDRPLDPDETPVVHPRRRRRTRREFWNLVGISAAAWVMLFALVRIWWRIYLVVEQ